MASYEEQFTSKMDWAMPFQRTGKFPLDRTDLFSSYDDAVKYAAGNTEDPDERGLCGTSYIGQIITVYENDVLSVYLIDAQRNLSTIAGGSAAVDNLSITKNDNNQICIKGFSEAADGYMLVKDLTSGSVKWVQAASLEEINNIKQQCEESAGLCNFYVGQCEDIQKDITSRIWIGTQEGYEQLTEVYDDHIYIITDGFYSGS